jgi:glucose/arabinose dehydrogenase
MFINDVGQGTYEEIDEGKAGRDFGWQATEGPFAGSAYPAFTAPVFAYGRTTGTANQGTQGDCIVGAAFYNPAAANFPAEYVGKYFFGDFPYESWIRYLDPEHPELGAKVFAENTNHAGIAVAPDGAMYYTDHDAGAVRRIVYGNGTALARRMGRVKLGVDWERGLTLRFPDGRRADMRGRVAP